MWNESDELAHIEDTLAIEHVNEDCQCEGKQCSKCDEVRCFGWFGPKGDGLKAQCKLCGRAYQAKYRAEHVEEAKSYRKVHYQKTAEERRAYSRRYSRNHPEKIKENNRKYAPVKLEKTRISRQQDPERWRNYGIKHEESEKRRTYRSKWKEEHRSRLNELARNRRRRNIESYRAHDPVYRAARRTRKTLAGGRFTLQEWDALKAKYDYTCLRCGRNESEVKLTPDHVIPISKGGVSYISNIQPLCYSCNSRKNNKTIDYRR